MRLTETFRPLGQSTGPGKQIARRNKIEVNFAADSADIVEYF